MKHELTIFAQELRKNQTPEEAKLWYQFLRKYPVRFRRQFPIGHYIADFYCAGAKIVIELDGSQHYQQEVRDYDAQRTATLERNGLKVIRFSNREINQEFFHVCTAIDMEVKDRVGARNVPSSAPSGGTFPPEGKVRNERKPMEFITNSPDETEALGAALGKIIPSGTVLAYRGDLGAGKTAFTRGLARGLGYTEPVTSPTYTIVNEYLGGRLPLFHFDMYRLRSSDDLWDIGWEDYLERGGICAVEWSENVADALEEPILVTIEKLGETSRRITVEGGKDLADLSL